MSVEDSEQFGRVYLGLKSRQHYRECKRQLNIKQGLVAVKSRKGSLHSDLDIAIELIEKLIFERGDKDAVS